MKLIDSLAVHEISSIKYEPKIGNARFEGRILNFDLPFKEVRAVLDLGNEKLEGDIRITFLDGSIYSGGYKEGIRQGFGKFISKDGVILEGEWHDKRVIGKRYYTKESDIDYVEGEFEELNNEIKSHYRSCLHRFKNGNEFYGPI